MWQQVYGVADAALVPIGHVTNGVHARTWLAPEAETFWKRTIGLDLDTIERGKDPWAAAEKADAGEFWAMRSQLRARLVQFIRERLARQARRRGEAPEVVLRASQAFDPNALTIGFARRFATYKRAPLIFREPERLRRILSDSKRPLQIVFAGKAHPRDRDGQAYAAEVHRWTREQGFEGRVALIEVLPAKDLGVSINLSPKLRAWAALPMIVQSMTTLCWPAVAHSRKHTAMRRFGPDVIALTTSGCVMAAAAPSR